MSDPLRVLLADDEPLARRRLQSLLDRESDIEVVAAVASGAEAAEQIGRLHDEGVPLDVAFLDVQMPGLTGIDVVRAVGPERMPLTVFVTAYDQHAVEAFELAAVDYLTKPFENDRFEAALERTRQAVRTRDRDALHDRLLALLEGRPPPPEAPTARRPEYLERIAVEMRGQIRVVPVGAVDYLDIDGDYVAVHVGEQVHLIRDTLSALEERLDPDQFFRIHRSTIVRLDRIESLLTAPGGDYAVRLQNRTRLSVARGRRDALAERLGFA